MAIVLSYAMSGIIWGGVIATPFIGLVAGFASALFPPRGRLRRALFSLASLYCAAALFGFAMGAYALLTGQNSGEGWHRIPGAVVVEAAVATLWGLTFTGYFIVLWPLAYANHSMLWRVWQEAPPTSTSVG